jgi:hypothetical protein
MRKSILCTFAILGISLILVAGCTSSTGTPNTSASSPGAAGNAAAGQEQVVTLVNGTYAFNASIYDITTTALPSGRHQVNIFVTVTNAGKTPVQLRWFSTLTNAEGVSFGGVGVSHGGNGAETPPLMPGISATGRDYITIDSDQDYQTLSKGTTLTVNFVTEPSNNQTPVSFSTAWILDPSVFT